MAIRVLLADDHTIVRQGLKALLDAEPDIEVVGEAADGWETIQQAEELKPDVVLMDITMPRLNGLEATRRLKRLLPQVKTLVLTVHTNEEYVREILRAGAAGYILKEAAVDELVSAVHAVARGDSFLSPAVSRIVVQDLARGRQWNGETVFDTLTPREREVLQLIGEGHTNQEIAEILAISVKTVETHRAQLRRKLNIHDRAGLIHYAIRKGLVHMD
jgi:two-component system response regulator NreC